MGEDQKDKPDTYDYELYEAFTQFIKRQLRELLRSNGFETEKKLYISLTGRAKDPKSLQEKLQRRQIHLDQVSDLSGCRVVFYLERDMYRFQQILGEVFEIKDYQTKYEKNDYKAVHLSISLKSDALNDGTQLFKGLWCEVQLTTGFYHVWSEVFHDWHYKANEGARNIFPAEYKALDTLAQDLMEKHIVEAQKQVEHLLARYQTLDSGRKVFDAEFINSLRKSKNTEELFEGLKILKEHLDQFGNRTSDENMLVDLVDELYKRVDSLKVEEIVTPWGNLPGKSVEEVKLKLIELLNDFRTRYQFPERVLSYYAKALAETPSWERQVSEYQENLFRHNPNAIQQFGFSPQLKAVAEIINWSPAEKNQYSKTIEQAGKALLSPSFEGRFMSEYDKLTIQMGSLDQLPFTSLEKIAEIRKETFDMLAQTFDETEFPNKLGILQTMQIGTHTPYQGRYGEQYKTLILDYCRNLFSWFKQKVDTGALSNEELQEIEEQLLSVSRTFEELKSDTNYLAITAQLKSDVDYQAHRKLIGYLDMVEEGDWEVVQQKRHFQIMEMSEQISKDNLEEWVLRIEKLLTNYDPIDLGKYQYFFTFLEKLGREKPDIALSMISELVEKVDVPFIESLLVGVFQNSEEYQSKTMSLMNAWVDKGSHLLVVSRTLSHLKHFDKSLLGKVITASDETDLATKNKVLNSVTTILLETFPDSKALVGEYFKAIKHLSDQNIFYWTDTLWLRGKPFLESLTAGQWELLLEQMMRIPAIDYREEQTLAVLAQTSPERVMAFFKERITAKKGNESPRYDAVPFRMEELAKPLSQHPTAVLEAVLKWFEEEDAMLNFEAAHFVPRIFSNFDPAINEVLVPLLRESVEKADVVLSILEAYDGEPFIHELAKEYIKLYGNTQKNRRKVMFVLSQIGSTWGEYGVRDKFRQRKDELATWTAEDKNTQAFLKEYGSWLDENIRSETKRSDDMVDAMKRQFEY